MDRVYTLSYGPTGDATRFDKFTDDWSKVAKMALDHAQELNDDADGMLMVHRDGNKGIVIIDEKNRHHYYNILQLERAS